MTSIDIPLPNGGSAKYDTNFAVEDYVDPIIERGPDGTYCVGYISLDSNTSNTSEEAIDSEHCEGGRCFFEVYRKSLHMGKRPVARALLDRVGGFLPEDEFAGWSCLISDDRLEGKTVEHFLTAESDLRKMTGSEFGLFYEGQLIASAGDMDVVNKIVEISKNGLKDEKLDDNVAKSVEMASLNIGDKFDLTKFYIELPDFDWFDGLEGLYCALADSEAPIWLVDCYEHGLLDYSLRNTVNYPDRQWDVSVSGYYVPPADVVEALHNGDMSFDLVTSSAKSDLKIHTEWCNGNVYGTCVDIVRVVPDAEGDYHAKMNTEESSWGNIGIESAELELADMVGQHVFSLPSVDAPATERVTALRNYAEKAQSDVMRKCAIRYLITMHENNLRNKNRQPQTTAMDHYAHEGDISFLNASGVAFDSRDLTGLDASSADLRNASFKNAVLNDTDFSNSNLRGANFSKAIFKGVVDFTGADLTTSKFPDGFFDDTSSMILRGTLLPGSRKENASVNEDSAGLAP